MTNNTIRTLTVATNYLLSQDRPEIAIDRALNNKLYNRCELTLKSSAGINMLEDKNNKIKLSRCIDVIRKHDMGLVFAISAFQNSNNRNVAICAYEATRSGRREVIERICPNNSINRQQLKILLNTCKKDYFHSSADRYILSYFRYENFFQCVCDNCIEKFTHFMESNGNFSYDNLHSLINPNFMFNWISWKQECLQSIINELTIELNIHPIIEIDFDYTKRYLSGPMIEEGLNFHSIIETGPEVYLHIEPCVPITDKFFTRSGHKDGYVNHLRYLICLSNEQSAKIHFFFWFLTDKENINAYLKYYLQIVNEVRPYGVVFYTTDPLELSRQLSNYVC